MNTLRGMIKRAIRPFVAKPWNSPVMEFRYGLWNGVSALFSESGRQLGEENTRPFILNHHLPAETISCKYEGSRNGRAINISALRTAMTNFDEALAITQAVREFHCRKVAQASSGDQLGIWDLYVIARASIALIGYQQRYAEQPAPQSVVSDALTSQYQFISGVFMICREMMNNGDPAIAENRHLSASELYSYADEHGIFISFNGMACAGSTKKIMEFLEFCGGAGEGASETIDLGDLVVDPENWYRYSLSTIELDCILELESLQRRHAQASVDVSHYEAASQIFRSIASYCTDILGGVLVSDDTLSFSGGVMARQNAILKLLKRQPVHRISETHLMKRLGV